VVEIEFAESGKLVLIRNPKLLLVLSREQFTTALRKGKAYRRRQTMATRHTQAHNAGDSDARV
jgi:hypothetical protein